MYQNEEHKKIVEERGDGYEYIGSYRCKEVTIDCKNKKRNDSYIRVKCPYCSEEYDVNLYSFKKGVKCNNCCNAYENSFGKWLVDTYGEDAIEKYWSSKNTLNPFNVATNSTKKIWLICQKHDYHNDNGGYETKAIFFYKGSRCPYCCNHHGKVHPKDSFGQWLIDEYGEGAIEKYWSSKNIVSPFDIAPNSTKKIWMLCQDKNYHNNEGGYKTTAEKFHHGRRCPYCNPFASHKVHKLDSFGALYPEKAKYWSKNNKKSPFEVSPKTPSKYKFICEKCGEEFEKKLRDLNVNNVGVVCINCHSSQLEQSTKEVLDKYNIKHYREYIFNDLIGIGNGYLRFDFYLPDYNTLIECQGQQHEEWQEGWQSKEIFENQQINDQRKRDYCKRNNIKLIEIWYYEVDNIEEILKEELDLIK